MIFSYQLISCSVTSYRSRILFTDNCVLLTGLPFALVFFGGVTPEVARWRKLTEFMAYHVFRDIDRNELVAVVYSERVAYEIWRDHGPTRPGFDDRLSTRIVLLLDLIVQPKINVWAFFE